MYANNPFRTT